MRWIMMQILLWISFVLLALQVTAFSVPARTRTSTLTSSSQVKDRKYRCGSTQLYAVDPNTATAAVSATSALLNMERVKLRLDGLSPYAVVATLILNASLRLFSMFRDVSDERDKPTNFLDLVLISICIISSSFASVVFTMISIHTKAAIGLGKDEAYLKYFAATSFDRTLGFRSFQLSYTSFLLAFALKVQLLLNIRSEDRITYKLFFVSFASVFVFMGWRFLRMSHLATTLIFIKKPL